MNPYALPPLITSVLLLLLGSLVFLKNPKSKPNILFFLEKLAISIWLYSDYRMFSANLPGEAFFCFITAYIAIIFIPVFFLHFTLVFLGIHKLKKLLIVSYLLGGFFELALLLTDDLISGVTKHYWGYYCKVGFLHTFFLIIFAFMVALSLWLLYRNVKDRTRSAEERNKIKLVLSAYIVAYQAWVDFLPKYGFELYPVGSIFVGIWVFVVTYVIVKHRLFDIHVVIRRGTTYALTFFLGILPSAIIVYSLQKMFPLTAPIALVVSLAVVLSFVFHKIYPYSERFVQKRLFKKRMDYYKVLHKFSDDLVTALDLQNLLQRFDETLHEVLQVSSVEFYLTGPLNEKYPLIHASAKRDFVVGRLQKSMETPPEQKRKREDTEMAASHTSNLIPQWKSDDALVSLAYQAEDVLVLGEMEMMAREKKNETLDRAITQMREAKAEVCMPLKREDNMIGFALLGPREQDKYYAPGDLELLHIIGQNACVAIQNALLVENMIRSYQTLHRTQRFAALGELVAGLS